MKKTTENNTASVYGDGVVFIRITDKLRIQWCTKFCLVINWKERREPCTANLYIQIQNCSVKNLVCLWCIFVEWPVKPFIQVDSWSVRFNSSNETKLNNLDKGNPPHFCSLHSDVMNFFNRNCMKPCIVVESTANHYHYEGDTIIIRMALSREVQRFCSYVWFVGKIIDSNGCTFCVF